MKHLTYASTLFVSIAALVSACSSDETNGNGTPDGGAGASSTGGSSSGTGGASSGTGGASSGTGGASSGTGGKSGGTGGAAGGTGGAAGGTGGKSGGTGGKSGGTGGAAATDGGTPEGGTPQTCDAYCTLEKQKCTFDAANANHQFTSNGTCMSACAGYATTGSVGDSSGNTLQCRLTHLGFIKTDADATMHCPHTGANPTAFCVNP